MKSWFLAIGAALVAMAVTTEAGASLPEARLDRIVRSLEPRPAPEREVLVVAHRGCWKDTAENSLAAIEACIALGVDIVELDVRRTADGVLVLMHDSTVDRTTNGKGAVSKLTYAQLVKLRLRSGRGGADAALTDAPPPRFEDAMRAARGRIMVNLDAKSDVYADAFAVLERTGTTRQIIMKRRVQAGAGALARETPFSRVLAMPIIDQQLGDAASLLAGQNGAPAAEIIYTDPKYLRRVHEQLRSTGTRIWVNTLNPEHAAGLTDEGALSDPGAVWGALIADGVSIIQTDEPDALIAYLERTGRRATYQPGAVRVPAK